MVTSAISRAMAAPEWMAMPISAADKAGESLMPSPIKPENLSLGEKQKIYLARTLLGNSSCILLDQPGSNLDEKTEHSLINYLLKFKEKKLILVISHNAYYDAVADKTYEIRKGMIHQVQSH